MKVYVLAVCCDSGNYTPTVFTDENKARDELFQRYNEETTKFADSICDSEFYDKSYQITYVDDTCLEAEIFEVEVDEGKFEVK